MFNYLSQFSNSVRKRTLSIQRDQRNQHKRRAQKHVARKVCYRQYGNSILMFQASFQFLEQVNLSEQPFEVRAINLTLKRRNRRSTKLAATPILETVFQSPAFNHYAMFPLQAGCQDSLLYFNFCSDIFFFCFCFSASYK